MEAEAIATKTEELLKGKRPLIISGPCSAETEDQLIETARLLAVTGKVDILRAGIWKPRTRPGNFEGVGKIGLSWLKKAKSITQLPVAVEVATAKQVEEALFYEVDILWVGARTTANPFSVQEIADVLKGTAIPVLIKNPTNPDLELWIGAVERLAKAGLKKLGLIHRGFSSYGNTTYRNAPMWQLAIEMKRRNPDLLMLNDPSHICGRRDSLLAVAQNAINLGFDGLMIETHIDPDNAWSDAKQQILPAQLFELLNKIIWRSENNFSMEFQYALENLRDQIDQLDDEILQLLSRRMKITDSIGSYKKAHNITILQTKRWNNILERATAKSEMLELSKKFITQYLDAVHIESISHQTKVFNS